MNILQSLCAWDQANAAEECVIAKLRYSGLWYSEDILYRSDAVSVGTFVFSTKILVRYSEVYVIAGVVISRSDLYIHYSTTR